MVESSQIDAGRRIRSFIPPPYEDESLGGIASVSPSFWAACADRIVVAFPCFEADGLDRIDMAFCPFVAAGWTRPVIKPPSEDDDRERFASACPSFWAACADRIVVAFP